MCGHQLQDSVPALPEQAGIVPTGYPGNIRPSMTNRPKVLDDRRSGSMVEFLFLTDIMGARVEFD